MKPLSNIIPTLLSTLTIVALVVALPALEPGPTQLEGRLSNVKVSFRGGSVTGRSLLGTESFDGIPFAHPPVGPLRLKPPQRYSDQLRNYDGTRIAPSCSQMIISSSAKDVLRKTISAALSLPILKEIKGQEDCLTIKVQRPAGTKADAKLPVLFWIHGGGFQFGTISAFDAASLFATAVPQGQPFVFVAVNYRLGGFGFLPGAEVKKDGSANLGLLDQRMGLEWVADNIGAFGGDPSQVTIWGESAGAVSVFDQMLLYGGNATYKDKPLFRGAIMNSGSATPTEDVDGDKGQAVYDQVVRAGGCVGPADTLDCLRKLPYQEFYNAVTSLPSVLSYSSLAMPYLPRPDGTVLPSSPEEAIAHGQFYKVPAIIGDQEDEGTLFSQFTTNITTTDKLTSYLSELYFPKVPKATVQRLVNLYSEDPAAGSPFRTGNSNQLYPGYKRIAALLGDISMIIIRRVTLDTTNTVAPDMPTWSYLASYNYGTPTLGTFHASDLVQIFYGVPHNHASDSCRSYYFNFLYNLDPNKGVGAYMNWPRWSQDRNIMWFKSASQNELLKDDFRSEVYTFLQKHQTEFHL